MPSRRIRKLVWLSSSSMWAERSTASVRVSSTRLLPTGVLYQYSRSAKELWKFCNLADVEMTAQVVLDPPPIDWWGRGALKRP
jgi:hypothetical protein